jgi:hypothetical protein
MKKALQNAVSRIANFWNKLKNLVRRIVDRLFRRGNRMRKGGNVIVISIDDQGLRVIGPLQEVGLVGVKVLAMVLLPGAIMEGAITEINPEIWNIFLVVGK